MYKVIYQFEHQYMKHKLHKRVLVSAHILDRQPVNYWVILQVYIFEDYNNQWRIMGIFRMTRILCQGNILNFI